MIVVTFAINADPDIKEPFVNFVHPAIMEIHQSAADRAKLALVTRKYFWKSTVLK